MISCSPVIGTAGRRWKDNVKLLFLVFKFAGNQKEDKQRNTTSISGVKLSASAAVRLSLHNLVTSFGNRLRCSTLVLIRWWGYRVRGLLSHRCELPSDV